MIKLFVVEDEIIMRNGLKSIDWKSADIEFVGEASDGELAYPMIMESRPDILITDIKMPFMDGLELSERVKRELPELQIIILSGFDEFTYAQKAVSLGVTEYLLKPVMPSKLLDTVCKVKDKIEESRRQLEEQEFSDGIPQEKLEIQKQLFFRHLVMNSRSSSELLDMAQAVDINLTARCFCMILMNLSISGLSGNDSFLLRNEMQEKIESILMEENGWTFIDRGENGFAFLVTRNHEDTIRKSIKDTLERIRLLLEKEKSASYYISIGSVVNRVSEIKLSYDQATKASAYRFLAGPNQIINVKDLPKEGVPQADYSMDFNDAVSNNDFREVLENFLRTGTREEIDPLIDEMFVRIGEQNLRSKIFLTYQIMDLYLTILRFAKEMEIETDEIDAKCGDLRELLQKEFTPEAAREFLTSYLDEIFLRRDSKKEKRFNSALRDAVEYIDANFDSEEISLAKVAYIANVSPNHFSAIFSQEMGTTFMEYLIQKRMNLAKTLLMTTDLRSSEIAYRVGYKDPHYFSHTFKKNMGMTPKEYRTRGEK